MRPRVRVLQVSLPPGVVEVWRVPLVAGLVGDARLTGLLTPREVAHARRVRHGGPEWATTRGALRWVLARHTGQPGGSLVIGRASNGKPALAGNAGPHFSLSHTTGLALVAVASDRPVGVDVERVDPRAETEGVMRDFLTPADRSFVHEAPEHARPTAFHNAWVRQEARLKLTGQGLEGHGPVPPSPDVPIVIRRLRVGEDYAAAVAAEGGNWRVKMRDLRDEL